MKSVEWKGEVVRFIDQTKLPSEENYIETGDYEVVAGAIRELKIRGAPAIGIAAAYGICLAALRLPDSDLQTFRKNLLVVHDHLASNRPTAVNLFWALQRMKDIWEKATTVANTRTKLIDEALKIHEEDRDMCRRIGEYGAALVPQRATILTHCNTGALATGGEGTAQSIITTAHRQGKSIVVYSDETRPLLQGARLTTWELMRNGIDVTLITDNMAAFVMKRKKIDLVVVGADRIAANGDVANKIGTYSLAVLCKHHRVPFYVAAPSSTIDCGIESGDKIPIEERSGKEVTESFGRHIAPDGVKVYSPAFDVTPCDLVTSIITERGVHKPPYDFRNLKSKEKTRLVS